ncbi:hypothetical protein ACFWIW_24130 [Amycolatopsis sp. NPDC058340]|uniref:hypothetical protein n=1 Tax=Amycolatopsis sp. NPDC058340 TaxID=3346453 RepID=UPI003646AF8C
MKTYHAEVTRDGRSWLIRVREIDRSTQALRYKDVVTMANELIEIMDGVKDDEYDLYLEVHLPISVKDRQARAEVLREEAQRKLGMSFQRASQLAKSS